MKIYIHKLLLLFFLLFGVVLSSAHWGSVSACDLEDTVDGWDFGDDYEYDDTIDKGYDEDGNMIGSFGFECVADFIDDSNDAPDPDWFIKDEYDDEDDDWGDDPCEMGDCDDLYDNIKANEENKTNEEDFKKEEKEEEEECTPQKGINGAIKRINGKDECVTDCMGVKGGKAYTKECHGETICIDGNNGVFTNTLTGEALDKFEQIEQEMQQNCLRTSLMNSLNEHYGIQIDYSTSQQYPGSFNPCNYSIIFSAVDKMDVYSVSAELFHAYQEQYLNGLLNNIQNSADHKGGSNIEAEEKAFGLLCNNFTFGIGIDECYELLNKWCLDFLSKYGNQHSNIILTVAEQQNWFEAVEEFRGCNQGKFKGTLYDAPVDQTLLPITLLNLWSHAEDCSEWVIIRPVIGKPSITFNKWKR